METPVIHTWHSLKRCQQRGVTRQMVEDTVRFGDVIYKQGLRFYIMTEKRLPSAYERRYNERLKNTVVILGEDDIVLSVYKNANAHSNIKKKSKYLYGKAAMKQAIDAVYNNREYHNKTVMRSLSPRWKALMAA